MLWKITYVDAKGKQRECEVEGSNDDAAMTAFRQQYGYECRIKAMYSLLSV